MSRFRKYFLFNWVYILGNAKFYFVVAWEVISVLY